MELVQTSNGKHGRALPSEHRLRVFLEVDHEHIVFGAEVYLIYLHFSDELEVFNVDVDFIARGQIMWVLPVLRLDLLQPLGVPFRVG